MERLIIDIYKYIEEIAKHRIEADIYGQEAIEEAKRLQNKIINAFPSTFKSQLLLIGQDGDVSRI